MKYASDIAIRLLETEPHAGLYIEALDAAGATLTTLAYAAAAKCFRSPVGTLSTPAAEVVSFRVVGSRMAEVSATYLGHSMTTGPGVTIQINYVTEREKLVALADLADLSACRERESNRRLAFWETNARLALGLGPHALVEPSMVGRGTVVPNERLNELLHAEHEVTTLRSSVARITEERDEAGRMIDRLLRDKGELVVERDSLRERLAAAQAARPLCHIGAVVPNINTGPGPYDRLLERFRTADMKVSLWRRAAAKVMGGDGDGLALEPADLDRWRVAVRRGRRLEVNYATYARVGKPVGVGEDSATYTAPKPDDPHTDKLRSFEATVKGASAAIEKLAAAWRALGSP